MAPFALEAELGKFGAYAVYLAIGLGFGATLEMAGFANSPKLAAQFYFKDMTVLKVMFTAIITAMVLVFGASAFGWLDYTMLWVNPTYLWPGIVGGLIMGVGFIVGGFCPGTSLVAAATLKIDGLFFALGAIFGIFLFGETVSGFAGFWNSSFQGRVTLFDWLGVPAGVVVVGVVLMAIGMFWAGEQLERRYGGLDPAEAPRGRYAGAVALLAASVLVLAVGQPTTEERWERIAEEKETVLAAREVQIHPGELLDVMHDDNLKPVLLDYRSEQDFNIFHIRGARRVGMTDAIDVAPSLLTEPANALFITISNDEEAATEAWKTLVAESVPNVYILEGGINGWLSTFAPDMEAVAGGADELRYVFDAALGDEWPMADPDPHAVEVTYRPKVALEVATGPAGGGCG
jgi:rhodanese-related sulfurtransferase